MLCVPTWSELTFRDAAPFTRVTIPRTLEPSLKMMDSPLGGEPSGELTVARKVIVCPAKDGLTDEVIVVVVATDD